MTDRRTLSRYAPWLAVSLAMLAAALAVQLVSGARAERPGAGEQMRLKDAKVRRTVRFHEMADPSTVAGPLHLRNKPGLAVDIEMDPQTFSLMLVKANRKRFKKRTTDAAVSFAGGPAQPATIGLRGVGTLRAMDDKVSFKVKLFRAESFAPDVKLKRFYLMNMAHDPHEVEMVFSYRVLADLGLFPLHHQYARVTVNGQPQSMSLLVERPKDGLRRSHNRLVAVYRRRKPNLYQTVWSNPAPRRAASVKALRAVSYPQQTPASAETLGGAIDLDDYFTWLAACSIFMNRDVADELYLFEQRQDASRPAPLQVMAWDFDDMMVLRRAEALDDPLIFSCQYPLDLRIRQSPELYEGYRSALRRLLTGAISLDNLLHTLHEVRLLRDGLDDGRPEAVQSEAKRLRGEAVAEIERKLRARHAELLEKVLDPESPIDL